MQNVVVDGERSKEAEVISGVPQGTVLGPLLFILYINDIGEGTSSTIRLFADDALIYRKISSTPDAANPSKRSGHSCRMVQEVADEVQPSQVISSSCYQKEISRKDIHNDGHRA